MQHILVILLLVGLCVTGFILSIINMTSHSSSLNSSSTLLSFPSTVANGELWTVPSGQLIRAGTFFLSKDSVLSDFSILGNVFTPDGEPMGDVYLFQASLNRSQQQASLSWTITGPAQSQVEFIPAGYSVSTSFTTTQATLRTYSGYAINSNQLKLPAGTECEVWVHVDYPNITPGFINFLVSIQFHS